MYNVEHEHVVSIHGRFQPFHMGHLEYALAAYRLGELLYVGITNAEPAHTSKSSAAPHRHLPENNPFNYHMRLEMIRGALKEADCDLDRIRFVPFPIHSPSLITNYVPEDALHVITILDDWGERKLEMLRAAGRRVLGIRDMPRRTSGTTIRGRLRLGLPVSGLVPLFVEQFLLRGTLTD